jgi:hypothetical protein
VFQLTAANSTVTRRQRLGAWCRAIHIDLQQRSNAWSRTAAVSEDRDDR